MKFDRAGIVKEYETSFLLEPTKLSKIVDIIKEHSKRLDEKSYITFYVEREDNFFYETKVLDEVLSDDNIQGKSIKRFSINLVEEEKDETIVEIDFCVSRDIKVQFNIAYKNRDWCLVLADELDNQIGRTLKKGYLASFPLEKYDILLLPVLFTALLLGLFLFSSYYEKTTNNFDLSNMTLEDKIDHILNLQMKEKSYLIKIFPMMLLGVLTAMIITLMKPLSKISNIINRSIFYWGDVVADYDRTVALLSKIKWVILFGFIISILAGILVKYL